jgi:hypothetical protein
MRVVRIKNIQATVDTYIGMDIQPGAYYQVQSERELAQASADQKVQEHLSTDKILISDGESDLNYTDGRNWLEGNLIPVQVEVEQYSGFYPDQSSYKTDSLSKLITDSDGNLVGRTEIHTDAGSIRDDFSGTSMFSSITGVISVVEGSTTVIGIGTSFRSEVMRKNYIKLDSQLNIAQTMIDVVVSDTELTLLDGYAGSTGSGSASISNWDIHEQNGSVSIASSILSISSGTQSGSFANIQRFVDYMPLALYADMGVSSRNANQETIFGFVDDINDIKKQAVVVFDGVNPYTIKFRTSSSAAPEEIEETIIILPNGFNTADLMDYQIDLTVRASSLSIEGQIKATHTDHLPGPYDVLNVVASTRNTATTTATTFLCDVIVVSNVDQVNIGAAIQTQPLKVEIIEKANAVLSNFIDGAVATTTATTVPVRDTTYTEQTTNGRRSLVSSSAQDSAAGTGVRTVEITYYTQDFLGPFFETVTLSGTTAVNTLSDTICYVESVNAMTSGSGTGVGATGIISLKSSTGGGGVVIGTIAVGKTRTYWCHHYVSRQRKCYVSSMVIGGTGTVAGNGAKYFLRAKNISNTTAVDQQITDTIRIPGSVASFYRAFDTPVIVVGPARISGWVITDAAASYTSYLSFSFYEV